ncbi:hypothetical protein EKS21_09950, partial [Streptococcus mutans]|nr:hypothetical protein [Streptococcus mutans]
MLLVIKRTGVIQMNYLHYTAKHHHLQYSMTQLKVICSYYYRHYKVRIFRVQATISYNPSKKMWFYGFKAHMLVTLSGFIVNY